MQMLDHPNIVALKHCFFSTTDKEELFLNLVLEFVPETVNRIARNYSRINQRMPLIYVKLYIYQVLLLFVYAIVSSPSSLLSWFKGLVRFWYYHGVAIPNSIEGYFEPCLLFFFNFFTNLPLKLELFPLGMSVVTTKTLSSMDELKRRIGLCGYMVGII